MMQITPDWPYTATAARTQRDAAIQQGAKKAARIDPRFIERAQAHAVSYLQTHGTSSGELLTNACKIAGIESSDDRHFGAVFMGLIRKGAIRKAGMCARLKGHYSAGGKVYELGDQARGAK